MDQHRAIVENSLIGKGSVIKTGAKVKNFHIEPESTVAAKETLVGEVSNA